MTKHFEPKRPKGGRDYEWLGADGCNQCQGTGEGRPFADVFANVVAWADGRRPEMPPMVPELGERSSDPDATRAAWFRAAGDALLAPAGPLRGRTRRVNYGSTACYEISPPETGQAKTLAAFAALGRRLQAAP